MHEEGGPSMMGFNKLGAIMYRVSQSEGNHAIMGFGICIIFCMIGGFLYTAAIVAGFITLGIGIFKEIIDCMNSDHIPVLKHTISYTVGIFVAMGVFTIFRMFV